MQVVSTAARECRCEYLQLNDNNVLRRWCNIIKPCVFNVNYQPTCILLLQVWDLARKRRRVREQRCTHLAGLQYRHPFISPRCPQVLGGRGRSKWNLAYRIMAWRQGATHYGGGPADSASHLGSREAATSPSIPVSCPLGLQPVRQTGRAGRDQRSSLAHQAEACFDRSTNHWGQKWARFALFNATVWFHPLGLTGHRCIPTVALMP